MTNRKADAEIALKQAKNGLKTAKKDRFRGLSVKHINSVPDKVL